MIFCWVFFVACRYHITFRNIKLSFFFAMWHKLMYILCDINVISFSIFFFSSFHKNRSCQFDRLRSKISGYSRSRWIFYISGTIFNGFSRLCVSLFNYQSKIVRGDSDYLWEVAGCNGKSLVSIFFLNKIFIGRVFFHESFSEFFFTRRFALIFKCFFFSCMSFYTRRGD